MKPGTILIYDKEEAIRDSLGLILSDEGFVCSMARDLEEMQHILAKKSIDMLIIDSQNVGGELVPTLKKDLPAIYVVILSTYSNIEAALASIANGADSFILKPIEFEELISEVKKYLAHTPH